MNTKRDKDVFQAENIQRPKGKRDSLASMIKVNGLQEGVEDLIEIGRFCWVTFGFSEKKIEGRSISEVVEAGNLRDEFGEWRVF